MKRSAATSFTLLIAAWMPTGCAVGSREDTYLARFIAAERASKPFDPITTSRPAATMADAYQIQRAYVRQRVAKGDSVAGYKGGLMSLASLKSRNTSEPLVGTLFAAGWTGDGDRVSLCGYRKASFELKLGYILPSTSSNPEEPIRVVPVIDLPDIAYRNPDSYGAIDMVAANVSASRYVVGTARPIGNIDLDTLPVSLARDGQTIASGHGRETLGGQAESLILLRKLIAREARPPRPGDLIVTGKMGDRGWLPPGNYIADYGPLGSVGFTVSACARDG